MQQNKYCTIQNKQRGKKQKKSFQKNSKKIKGKKNNRQ